MDKRAYGAILGLGAAALCIASLWTSHISSRTLRVLVYDDRTGNYLVEFLQTWAQDNEVEIRLTQVSYDHLYEMAIQSGKEYDLLLVDDPWLPSLVEKGMVARVNHPNLTGSMHEFAPEFSQVCYYRRRKADAENANGTRPALALLQRCVADAADPSCREIRKTWPLYAIPFVGNAQLLVVAKDVWPEGRPNPSWPGLLQALEEHGRKPEHQRGRRPARFIVRGNSNNAALADFLPFLRAWGARLFTDHSLKTERLTFNKSDRDRQALEFAINLTRFSPVQQTRLGDADVFDYLLNDQAEAGICWLAYVMQRKTDGRNGWHEEAERLRYLPMPRPHVTPPPGDQNEDTDRAGVTGAWLLAVGSEAKNPSLAWEFVEKASSRKTAEDLLNGLGKPAPHEALLEKGPLGAVTKEIVRAARPRYRHPLWKEIEEAVGLRIRQAYWKTADVTSAVQRAHNDLIRIPGIRQPAPEHRTPGEQTAAAAPAPPERIVR